MLWRTATVLGVIPDALALAGAAMVFDPGAFARAAAGGDGARLALLVAYLAGLSQAVGHGAVLFLNRVRPIRFGISLLLMAAIYLASALSVAVFAILVADWGMGRTLGFLPTLAVIALAHAPRLLGALTLTPYFGETLDRVLDAWIVLLVVFGLNTGLGLPLGAAAMLALFGWLALRLFWLAFGQPLTVVVDSVRRGVAGEPLTLTLQNLVEALKERARGGAGPDGRR